MARQSDSHTTNRQFFLPEWIKGVHYAGSWHEVKEGTFKEGVPSAHGLISIYQDPYDDQLCFVKAPITGYRMTHREFRPVVVQTIMEAPDDGDQESW